MAKGHLRPAHEAAQEELSCPTPNKYSWDTRSAAKRAGKSFKRNGAAATVPYLCRCGEWHLTTKRKRKQ